MLRKEVTLGSPLRILDRSIHGGLGKGHLGVLLAPPGVGKSAFLVHLGLDALLRDRPVLHVAVGPSVDHVAGAYDALFRELADRVDLRDRAGVAEEIAHRRLIWSVAPAAFGPHALDDALAAFATHLGRPPALVLVDGFDWADPSCAATLHALKASAGGAGAELWMTARDARPPELGSAAIAPFPDACASLVDVAVLLEPHGAHVHVTLVKDFDHWPAAAVPLVLEHGALRPLGADDAPPGLLAPDEVTLLGTGCAGAEEEFGACAERWGVAEVNYTYAGRGAVARQRGLVELSEDELRLGEVSPAFVRAHLHRAIAEDPALAPILQLIWHQVSTAGEVFAVGALRPDGTVGGGTGWAVELARHWHKPAHVYDQELGRWFRWDGAAWAAEPPPLIGRPRFAGAGTRALTDGGRAAIRALFERSLGPAPGEAPAPR
jgi:hypothetical protein